jgi:hypothetical protein
MSPIAAPDVGELVAGGQPADRSGAWQHRHRVVAVATQGRHRRRGQRPGDAEADMQPLAGELSGQRGDLDHRRAHDETDRRLGDGDLAGRTEMERTRDE